MYEPPFEINTKIMSLMCDIMEKLGSLKPLNDFDKFPRLRKISRVKSVQASLAIEQNSITYDEATLIFEGRKFIGEKNEILAMTNAFSLYDQIDELSPSFFDLLKSHKIMMEDLLEDAGKLRNHAEAVIDGNGNIIHLAPPADMVEKNLKDLFLWLKTTSEHPLITSSIFHYEFEFIHPFTDGNGRIGRFFQTLILSKWKPIFKWIPIESIIKEHQFEYYRVINECDKKGDSTLFIEFMLECINKAINEVIKENEKQTLFISNKVQSLLNIMSEKPESATSLMKKLNLKNKDNFRSVYLLPALKADLIKMEFPNNPKSRNQRYYKK